MDNDYLRIQELLYQRANFQARFNLLHYDGSPEVNYSPLVEAGASICIKA